MKSVTGERPQARSWPARWRCAAPAAAVGAALGIGAAGEVLAQAQAREHPLEATVRPASHATQRHHLSGLVGYTVVDGEERGVTFGLDYEYRLDRRLGIGGVVERAFGSVRATTLLAVADVHVVRGLAVQTGPGVELLDRKGEERESQERFVYRVGALYEFEAGERGFTFSPQVHFDWVPGAGADSVVFALAFGRAF